MARKKLTVEEMEKKNQENIDNFIKQLKEIGVKDTTIEQIMADIEEHQRKLYEEAMRGIFERMRQVIEESNGD